MMEDKNQMAHQDPVDQEDLVETDVRPLEEREKEAVKGELIETEQPVDYEKEAEYICRWGAARASVIVMTPFLGSLALMANEVYMITRLSDLYGVELETGAIAGLIGCFFCGTDPLYPHSIPTASGTHGCCYHLWCREGG